MAVNKVQLANGTVLIDTTSVTVDAEHLASGYTALDKAGNMITGTAEMDVTVNVFGGMVSNESLILSPTLTVEITDASVVDESLIANRTFE